MDGFLSLRIVIDINIVFEGLTNKNSAASLIMDAWLAGLLNVHVSNALAYEYMDVLSRKLSEMRWKKMVLVLGELLTKADFIDTYYSWRPSSPDPGDDHVIDCAMNAGAVVLTSNVRDFRLAEESLGLQVMNPVEFLNYLAVELE